MGKKISIEIVLLARIELSHKSSYKKSRYEISYIEWKQLYYYLQQTFLYQTLFFKWSLTFIVETLERRDKYFVIQQKMLNRLLRHWLYAHYQIPKYLVNESLKNSKRWDFSLEKCFFFLIIACISMIQSSIHFLCIFWSIFQKFRLEKK